MSSVRNDIIKAAVAFVEADDDKSTKDAEMALIGAVEALREDEGDYIQVNGTVSIYARVDYGIGGDGEPIYALRDIVFDDPEWSDDDEQIAWANFPADADKGHLEAWLDKTFPEGTDTMTLNCLPFTSHELLEEVDRD